MKAALLLYPRVTLQSRLLAVLHGGLEGKRIRLQEGVTIWDGLVFESPSTELKLALVLLAQALREPRLRSQLFNVFEEESEFAPILEALPYRLPSEDVGRAGAGPHNEFMSWAVSEQDRLTLAAPHVSHLLTLTGEGRGGWLDECASELVTALSGASSLRSALAEIMPDQLDAQDDADVFARVAQQFCLQSVTGLLPDLTAVHPEEVIRLADECAASIESYKSRAAALTRDYLEITGGASSADFAQHATATIAGDYAALTDAMRSSSVWSVAKERGPVAAGASVSLTTALVIGASTGNIVTAVGGLGAGVLGQLLTTTLETLRRRRQLKAHYLYWRYAVSTRTAAAPTP